MVEPASRDTSNLEGRAASALNAIMATLLILGMLGLGLWRLVNEIWEAVALLFQDRVAELNWMELFSSVTMAGMGFWVALHFGPRIWRRSRRDNP